MGDQKLKLVPEASEPKINKKHKGSQSELIATVWLLGQGYEVFRNVSIHGIIDLVAVRNGVCHYFDVKSAKTYTAKNGNKTYYTPPLSKAQVLVGVKTLIVDGVDCWIEEQ